MNFRNLSISKKLFISPAIFVLALIVLGIISISGSQQSLKTMELLNHQANAQTGAALKFQRDLQAFNGNVFRLISQLNAGVEEEKLVKFRETLLAYLEGSKKSLEDFIANGNYTEKELGLLNKLKSELSFYAEDTAGVIDMTEVDGSTSVIMMMGADEKFSQMYKTIDEIVEYWQITGAAQYTAAVEDGEAGVQQFIFTSIFALLIAGGVAFWVTRMIRQPVQSLTAAMAELSGGNNEIEIPSHEETNEIGEMARAVLVFKDNAIEQARLQADAARHSEEEADRERQARADDDRRVNEERKRTEKIATEREDHSNKITNLIESFETRVSEVLSSVSLATRELQSTADSMSTTASSSLDLAEGVASASGEASRNVQTVASAAEELTSSINEISRQVQQANEVSEKAVMEADNSKTSVSALAETAKKISEVVNMINDIAGQTNLLALNATIEAARAGDAGKGFAVVASEVKSLANQTAKATEEIAQQINDMQAATNSAVSAIENIDTVISSIRQSTVGISSAIEEQSAATNEISRNVQEASSGTSEVSSKIEIVSAKAGETGAAAEEVQTASSRLDELTRSLKSDIENFLQNVRAA